jgi:hypothetical protein
MEACGMGGIMAGCIIGIGIGIAGVIASTPWWQSLELPSCTRSHYCRFAGPRANGIFAANPGKNPPSAEHASTPL